MSETTENISARNGNDGANLKQRMARDGREKIESGKRAAADQMDEIADALDVAGAQLDQSQPTLANYASKLAEGVGGIATRLREDSIEDLYHEVRRLAAQHPAMFVVGGAAVGLAIARFMKAEGGASGSGGLSDDMSADGGSRWTGAGAAQDKADPTASRSQADPLASSDTRAAGM